MSISSLPVHDLDVLSGLYNILNGSREVYEIGKAEIEKFKKLQPVQPGYFASQKHIDNYLKTCASYEKNLGEIVKTINEDGNNYNLNLKELCMAMPYKAVWFPLHKWGVFIAKTSCNSCDHIGMDLRIYEADGLDFSDIFAVHEYAKNFLPVLKTL